MFRKGKTILVVEDEDALRRALFDKLTREGFDAVEAKNGEEGLQKTMKHEPELVLLDIVMPKMDGITMLTKLREREAAEKKERTPVIFLTNLNPDDGAVRVVTKEEPAYYLMKTDWTIDEVVEIVKARLGISKK